VWRLTNFLKRDQASGETLFIRNLHLGACWIAFFRLGYVLVKTAFHTKHIEKRICAIWGVKCEFFEEKFIASRRSKAAHLTPQIARQQLLKVFGEPERSPKTF
jgi:hypothetical protein